MRQSMVAVVVAAGLVWTVAAQADRGDPPSSPFAYAVFALGNLTLHDRVRVIDGAVASNDATATIGRRVPVVGTVVGRTIRSRKGAQADSLFCLLLRGTSSLSCQPVTLPLMS